MTIDPSRLAPGAAELASRVGGQIDGANSGQVTDVALLLIDYVLSISPLEDRKIILNHVSAIMLGMLMEYVGGDMHIVHVGDSPSGSVH